MIPYIPYITKKQNKELPFYDVNQRLPHLLLFLLGLQQSVTLDLSFHFPAYATSVLLPWLAVSLRPLFFLPVLQVPTSVPRLSSTSSLLVSSGVVSVHVSRSAVSKFGKPITTLELV